MLKPFCTSVNIASIFSYAAPQFAPYDFSYTFMSSTSILLTWTPPPMDDRSGSITHYEIEYSCQSCQREYRSAQHVQSLTVSSLQSGEEYTFYIAACVHSSCGSGLARSRKTVNVPPTGVYNCTVSFSYSNCVDLIITMLMGPVSGVTSY